jgi:hypothetical protein
MGRDVKGIAIVDSRAAAAGQASVPLSVVVTGPR